MASEYGGCKSGWHVVKDDGYSALCPICGLRWDFKPELIGKERELYTGDCPECRDTPKKRQHFYRYSGFSERGKIGLDGMP